MFVFHPSLWFCTILFHLCKLCEIVDLFLRLGHFMLCDCSSKYVQFHSPLYGMEKIWHLVRLSSSWEGYYPIRRKIIPFISPEKTWHSMNWVPYGRSIILLEGGLCHLSPCKNLTFSGLSPSWEKYYPTRRKFIPFIPLQKTWHLAN